MGSLEVQYSMQDVSLLSKDRYVNTFHVSNLGPDDDGALNFLRDTIAAFYTAPHGTSTVSIDEFLSPQVNGAGSTIKIYNMDGGPPHPPLLVETFTKSVPTASRSGLPSEVACCLSLHADPVPGIPKGRLRGRLYMGPLGTQATAVGVQATGRPGDAFMSALLQSGIWLQSTLHAHSPAMSWCVYSPTLRGSSPTALSALHGVTSVSVDDAWDTQRRRGVQPTAKYSYPTP